MPEEGRPDSREATVDCSIGSWKWVHGKCHLCQCHGRREQRACGRAGRHLLPSGLYCRGGGDQAKLDFQGRESLDSVKRPVLLHRHHEAKGRKWPMRSAPCQVRPAAGPGRVCVRLQLQRLLEGKHAKRCATRARHLPGTDFPWQVCRHNAWFPGRARQL